MSSYTSNNKIYFGTKRLPHLYLSNFHPAEIIIDNKSYNHTEGYYQACKHKDVNDGAAEYISQFKDPMTCKLVANSIPMTKGRKEVWEAGYKVEVMKIALKAKFTQHQDLQEQLLCTDDAELIEYAPWDEYWGSGKNGNGRNMLGKLLMELRDELR